VLESELFALLENTSDAAYTVDTDGVICSWNLSAERLLGYTAAEAVGRNVDELLAARDAMGTPALAGGSEASTRNWNGLADGIPNFELEIETRNAVRIWVDVTTIVYDNTRTGRRLFVRLMHDVNQHHQNEALLARMIDTAKQLVDMSEEPSGHAPVNPLSEQERRVLSMFAEGRDAPTIAETLNISAQTLRNHLYNVNRKLRTHNRLEAVTHAQRRGLID
jgi:PAS domain S-box-containing protein